MKKIAPIFIALALSTSTAGAASISAVRPFSSSLALPVQYCSDPYTPEYQYGMVYYGSDLKFRATVHKTSSESSGNVQVSWYRFNDRTFHIPGLLGHTQVYVSSGGSGTAEFSVSNPSYMSPDFYFAEYGASVDGGLVSISTVYKYDEDGDGPRDPYVSSVTTLSNNTSIFGWDFVSGTTAQGYPNPVSRIQTSSTVSMAGTLATYQCGTALNNALGLNTGSLQSFYYWPTFQPYDPNYSIVSVQNISSSVSTPSEVPSHRSRLFVKGYSQTSMFVTESNGSSVASPVSTPRKYSTFSVPTLKYEYSDMEAGDAFDYFNVDGCNKPNGAITLHSQQRYGARLTYLLHYWSNQGKLIKIYETGLTTPSFSGWNPTGTAGTGYASFNANKLKIGATSAAPSGGFNYSGYMSPDLGTVRKGQLYVVNVLANRTTLDAATQQIPDLRIIPLVSDWSFYTIAQFVDTQTPSNSSINCASPRLNTSSPSLHTAVFYIPSTLPLPDDQLNLKVQIDYAQTDANYTEFQIPYVRVFRVGDPEYLEDFLN